LPQQFADKHGGSFAFVAALHNFNHEVRVWKIVKELLQCHALHGLGTIGIIAVLILKLISEIKLGQFFVCFVRDFSFAVGIKA
jgi:hypothetical protein